MKAEGRNQWTEDYPTKGNIDHDVAHGYGYVISLDEGVCAYGALIIGIEPAYAAIDGDWLSDGYEPYMVVHRLAVADFARGRGLAASFLTEAEKVAEAEGVRWLRVDTNYDNLRMLSILENLGFTYCGKVYYEKGERLAFEKKLN